MDERAKDMRIRITKDGPYLVSGGVPLSVVRIVCDEDGESESWEQQAVFDEREKCGLCRCGMSESKPFCDGSHADVRFDGTETADRGLYQDRAQMLEGPRVDVADRKDLCANARFCHRSGTVWHRVYDDDEESARVVIAGSTLCPSGRYTAMDKATGEPIEPELPASIGFVQDPTAGVSGPIWVRGGIPVEAADGFEYEVRNRVTLCRCGKSENKPFCDGSHITCGFHDHL